MSFSLPACSEWFDMDNLLKTDLKLGLSALVSFCLLFRNKLSSYSRFSRRTCNKSNLKKTQTNKHFNIQLNHFQKAFFFWFILLVHPGVLLVISSSGWVLNSWEAPPSALVLLSFYWSLLFELRLFCASRTLLQVCVTVCFKLCFLWAFAFLLFKCIKH